MVSSGHYGLDYCPWALRFWEQENKNLENKGNLLAYVIEKSRDFFSEERVMCFRSGLIWLHSIIRALGLFSWCFLLSTASFVLRLPFLLLENGHSRSSPHTSTFHLLECLSPPAFALSLQMLPWISAAWVKSLALSESKHSDRGMELCSFTGAWVSRPTKAAKIPLKYMDYIGVREIPGWLRRANMGGCLVAMCGPSAWLWYPRSWGVLVITWERHRTKSKGIKSDNLLQACPLHPPSTQPAPEGLLQAAHLTEHFSTANPTDGFCSPSSRL